MTSHVEIPQPVVEQYFVDRAKAEGAAFTAFCEEHGYVRDIFEFTPEQRAEWNAVYDDLAADWDARRDQLKSEHAETPDAVASGASVGS
ncbi:hypothetical protein SEA_VANLEE_131 [Gordonia phage VanLee]|uniref:Uncharacterized protein n=1 Tax=Gordonia phage VanLee TaxID=2845816 RepID=A0A8F2IFJ6_9CAUD|nr:hypothetical protein QEH49_gp159 [Gordonia phage VanLee]QWS68247.1 hypothetical protein SEA_VANLEE_131 [Gordonia phage VanLee]